MTIRFKFIILIISILLSYLISIAVYAVTQNPVQQIGREKETLIQLSGSLSALLVESSRLGTFPLKAQIEAVRKEGDKLDGDFSGIDSLQNLKNANKRIQVSLSRIKSQKTFIGLAVSDLIASAEAAVREMEQHGLDTAGSAQQAFARLVSGRAAGGNTAYNLSLMCDQMKTLDERIVSSAKVLEDQFGEIDKEVASIQTRSAILSAAIILIVISAGLVFSFFLSGRIVASIKGIESHIKLFAGGDLRQEFNVRTRDEMGRLSKELNSFITSLRSIIGQIKVISEQSISIKNNLMEVSTHSSASINEMNSEINSIQSQISLLDGKIGTSSQKSEAIVESLNSLDNQLIEQSSMVEEASSAISEMAASIENVTNITATRRESTRTLVSVAKDGSDRLHETVSKIETVYNNLDDVSNVAQVINAIAQQTDLLAMNAAIEAAHAGTAGRGFAVVAEEIRKLAEAVNEQSKQIESDIRSITEHIKDAADMSKSTMSAFSSIHSGISAVDNSFEEIAATMSELHTGSQQIIEAMVQLRDISEYAKEASNTITENSDESNSSIKVIKDISTSVISSIDEITGGIRDINGLMGRIHELSNAVSKINENLNREINYFTTA
ncbi:MAG: HAMP domain-containing protein [Spirochaetales bacterium]|nr:HAMP domain-containing protein [Spirochaetales bacterium]